MAEKIKSRRNASLDYWERREKEALKQTRVSEEEFAEKTAQVYKDMRKDINDRINRWYVRYANDSEIDITEAKKRVSKLDIEEYAELAKKYVALSRNQETRAEAFTDEANEQMKIYNLTMKVNRLENLKAQMGLDLCGGFSRLQKNYGEFLTDQMMKEFTRQSGILGMTTTNPRRFRRQMEAIVNGSFHNATFSQRLWNQQDALKGELDRLLTRALIQGLNPRTVAPELKKKFDSSEQAADLLMITELCRVQTEAQKLAFQEFSYEDYTFICNGGACKECEALNGKHFKVKDMQAGRNAPPMHPRCRCSTAAYMDREAFEKWLEALENRSEENISDAEPYSRNRNPFMNDKPRSAAQLERRAEEIRQEMKEYVPNESKWSGKVHVVSRMERSDVTGAKRWNCDISTTAFVTDGTLWHEMLHSASVSHYNSQIYAENQIIEEASVEFLKQQICKEKGIKDVVAYRKYVSILVNTARYLKIDTMTFAKELYKQGLPERYSWLEGKVDDQLRRDNASFQDYNDVILYVRNLQGGVQ